MEILKFPNKILLTPCEEVTAFGEELEIILNNMYKTMLDSNGIGLAANQVGLNRAMFTMFTTEGQRLNIVNPKQITSSSIISKLKEGCLSFPKESLITGNRTEWIQICYQDEKGILSTRTFSGIDSVCVQHEMEHLEGRVFIQAYTINKAIRKRLAKKWGLK